MGLKGARGASEYIARSVTNIDSVLYKTNPVTTPTKSISLIIASKVINRNATRARLFAVGSGINKSESCWVQPYYNSTYPFRIYFYDYFNSHVTLFDVQINNTSLTNDNFQLIMISFDVSVQKKFTIIINGVDYTSSATINAYNNQSIDFSAGTINTSTTVSSSDNTISNLYFTTDYIDFSQESNRNLFVNKLGYPRDLKPLIEDATIPKPLIYLPFDDPSNLGKNLGTAGDFTVNGTVAHSADFTL